MSPRENAPGSDTAQYLAEAREIFTIEALTQTISNMEEEFKVLPGIRVSTEEELKKRAVLRERLRIFNNVLNTRVREKYRKQDTE